MKFKRVVLGTAAVAAIVAGAAVVTGGIRQGIPDASSAHVSVLPDRTLTPGDVLPVTAEQVCVKGYSATVRNVPQRIKDAVFAEYGVTSHPTGAYEVDHLISLELGGSNDIRNLWPEPAEPRPGYHEKDALENRLHALVCAGTLSLSDAQQAIATDWYQAYLSYK